MGRAKKDANDAEERKGNGERSHSMITCSSCGRKFRKDEYSGQQSSSKKVQSCKQQKCESSRNKVAVSGRSGCTKKNKKLPSSFIIFFTTVMKLRKGERVPACKIAQDCAKCWRRMSQPERDKYNAENYCCICKSVDNCGHKTKSHEEEYDDDDSSLCSIV